MPETVYTPLFRNVTKYETQRKLFRNPRGQKYWYLCVFESPYWKLYKSSDGVTWELEKEQYILAVSGNPFSTSMDFYEETDRIVVYSAVGQQDAGDLIFIRFEVLDTTSGISNFTTQSIPVSAWDPTIIISRGVNAGYVWIIYARLTKYKEKGVTYTGTSFYCVASLTPYPDGSPIWAEHAIYEYDVAFSGARCFHTAVSLEATSDVLVIFLRYDIQADGYGDLVGVEMTWDGAMFTHVLEDEMDRYTTYTGDNPRLSAVVDSNNLVHLIWQQSVPYLHRITWTVGTGWGATAFIIPNDGYSSQLSIDRTATPNKLYVFFQRAAWGEGNYVGIRIYNLNWVKIDEDKIKDDAESLIWFTSTLRDYEGRFGLVYQRYTSYTVRFLEYPPVPVVKIMGDGLTWVIG